MIRIGGDIAGLQDDPRFLLHAVAGEKLAELRAALPVTDFPSQDATILLDRVTPLAVDFTGCMFEPDAASVHAMFDDLTQHRRTGPEDTSRVYGGLAVYIEVILFRDGSPYVRDGDMAYAPHQSSDAQRHLVIAPHEAPPLIVNSTYEALTDPALPLHAMARRLIGEGIADILPKRAAQSMIELVRSVDPSQIDLSS